ncbi:transposase [Micromonospora ureilytica]|uniref:Transposase n=1 Tax=Micromonospora ureilytica TaxID=709868 RepID=A0ABS0JD82_9ACTN|nr:transposase [Micromonospora ureilytica]
MLCGILFVLYTAVPWEYLPQELGFGSGMTCWRRLRDWNDAGVWQRLHEVLLGRRRAAGQLDMSRAVIDGSHVRTLNGGSRPVRAPVDRRKPGSEHHVITDAGGIPLATALTGGNRHGIPVARRTVERLMRQLGLRGLCGARPDAPPSPTITPCGRRTWCNAGSSPTGQAGCGSPTSPTFLPRHPCMTGHR